MGTSPRDGIGRPIVWSFPLARPHTLADLTLRTRVRDGSGIWEEILKLFRMMGSACGVL